MQDSLVKINIEIFFVFQPQATGEQKTKPTQSSVRELRGLGLSPDLVCHYLLFLTPDLTTE